MPKHTRLQPHLSVADIAQRYRGATDPVARSQWHILWLLAQPTSVHDVAAVTHYSENWIRAVARRYNAQGAESIGDKRKYSRGAPPLLTAADQAALVALLTREMADGVLWDGPKVAAWIAAKTGRSVRRQRGWEYLTKLGFRILQPRPQHTKGDKDAQAAFKKNSPTS